MIFSPLIFFTFLLIIIFRREEKPIRKNYRKKVRLWSLFLGENSTVTIVKYKALEEKHASVSSNNYHVAQMTKNHTHDILLLLMTNQGSVGVK